MIKKINIIIWLPCLLLFFTVFSGCTGLKEIPKDKHLYEGNNLYFDSLHFIAKPKNAKAELKKLIPLETNTKFLGMRPFLSFYYLMPTITKDSGFVYNMKYKVGETPKFIEELDPKAICKIMENRLQNLGNFDATVTHELVSKDKTAKLKFYIKPNEPYILQSIKYPDASKGLNGELHRLQSTSLLKVEQNYNLADFEKERLRIEEILKEKGYFFFSASDLLFIADTAIGTKKINIRLLLKPEILPKSHTAFKLNSIYIFDDYTLQNYSPDTAKIASYNYVSDQHQYKPKTILKAVFLEKDSFYSRTNHYSTIKQLMGIGIYKFAKANFALDDSIADRLNAFVYLTPAKKISLSVEMNAAVKNNNSAGPGLNLNYKNRNTFRGAELLAVTLGGEFQTQYKGDTKGQTSFKINLDASITIPKFLPSFHDNSVSKFNFPKTIISAGIGRYSRIELYNLQSFNVSLGYKWKPSERISHQYNAIEISYTNLLNSTAEFEEYLNENPTVRKSFDEQFIIGTSYDFGFTNFHKRSAKHHFFLNETIDLAGNIASIFTSLKNDSYPSSENQQLIWGIPFSQFIRIKNEVRYFYDPNKKSQIAYRIILAAGVPYGNSSTIPYNRQYFVGGTNSLRAFLARSIGPGSYRTPDSLTGVIVDRTGDIKIETNLEYRFNIYKILKGAVFTDAGNIWLVNEDPQREGGKFNKKTFISEIAIGSGLGIRLDFNFILIRLDLGIPLRIPELPEAERWVYDDINFGSKSWRKNNLVLNLAIGMPF